MPPGSGVTITWSESIAMWSAAIASLTAVIALGTLIKAVIEYQRQNSAKRFEIFQGLNQRFDSESFKKIRHFLDTEDDELADFDHTEKHNFIAFFEEIAITVNSRIMDDKLAFYMFGYYAIKAWRSKNFWLGRMMLGKESIYWRVYTHFTLRMMELEADLAENKFEASVIRF